MHDTMGLLALGFGTGAFFVIGINLLLEWLVERARRWR